MMRRMWASFLLVLYATITLAFIGRVLIRPRLDPSVRLAWIMVIEAVPLVGIAAYLLFGEVRMNHAEVQRSHRLVGGHEPSEICNRERTLRNTQTPREVGCRTLSTTSDIRMMLPPSTLFLV